MKLKLKFPLLAILLVGLFIVTACSAAPEQKPPAMMPLGLQVVFMSPVNAPELWRVPASGGEAVQITNTGGRVFDYDVSRDGEEIIFSVLNDDGGADLWLAAADTMRIQKLLDCGSERCIEPEWAPDSEYFAFTRAGNAYEDVWIFSMALKEAVPLLDDAVPGNTPSFSPDGGRIAFVEAQTGKVRIVDLNDGTNFRLPADDGLMGSWSPDGGRMVFVDRDEETVFAGADIYIAELATQAVELVRLPEFDDLSEIADNPEAEHDHEEEVDLDPGRLDVSVPEWHPDEQLLVIAQRPFFATFSKQLWLVPLEEGAKATAVTVDHNFAHGAYSWSPDGEQIVYQRFALEQTNAVPQVWVWQRENGEALLLADDAALPQWLP